MSLRKELITICRNYKDINSGTHLMRLKTIMTFCDDLGRAGFSLKKMHASDLKGRHVKGLLREWNSQSLPKYVIDFRIGILHWWAEMVSNPGGVSLPIPPCTGNELEIFCCECSKEIMARLTTGLEVYPHRDDLQSFPYWKCENCGNFVGCHHKTAWPKLPLGSIPSKEISRVRIKMHVFIDRIIHIENINRSDLYLSLGKRLGREFHIGNINSKNDERIVYAALREMGY